MNSKRIISNQLDQVFKICLLKNNMHIMVSVQKCPTVIAALCCFIHNNVLCVNA